MFFLWNKGRLQVINMSIQFQIWFVRRDSCKGGNLKFAKPYIVAWVVLVVTEAFFFFFEKRQKRRGASGRSRQHAAKTPLKVSD